MPVTSIFSFTQNVFYHFQEKFQIFSNIYFVNCNFFLFDKALTLYKTIYMFKNLAKEDL